MLARLDAPEATHPTPRDDHGPAGSERRQLTVLFCDLVGSTALSLQLDPEDLQATVRRYQAAASAVVTRHSGHVAQYLGDGIVAYFGYPAARDDDAERAVRAGLALSRAVAGLDEGGTPLAVRVGIHTGTVVVGAIGSALRAETLALGEAPNIAARLQEIAKPNTVVVSEATLRLLPGVFVTEDLGPHTLKGVREPIVAHRVVAPTGIRSRVDAGAGTLTPLVGRRVELATLVDRWEHAVDGRGGGILVVGEAGVGKTRLVYELRAQMTATPHTWLECRGRAYTQGTPFAPVIELFERGMSFQDDDTTAERLAKLERGLGPRLRSSPDAVPLMAAFVGLPHPSAYSALQTSPDAQRRRTLDLLAAWCVERSRVQPLVVFFEDIHWCDPSSLEVIARLVNESATARLLVVATTRPEVEVPDAICSSATTIALPRLTARQARAVIAGLGAQSFPDDVVEALLARAEGIPFYLEELTKPLLGHGASATIETIPATLHDSLMAQLDRLGTVKDVAQRAAVLGRDFSFGLLAEIAGLDEVALQQGLARLLQAEILVARGMPPRSTYSFRHALLQETAYQSLLKQTRRELHRQTVQSLKRRFPARAMAEPESLARHAEAAGLLDEAVSAYQTAGEQAQQRSAHEEAIAHFRKALELLASLPPGPDRGAREARIQMALGGALMVGRGYAHAETGQAVERSHALSADADDPLQRAVALGSFSLFCSTHGEMARALELSERVVDLGEATRDPSILVFGLDQMAHPLHFMGRFATSLDCVERAIGMYEPTRDHRVVAWQGVDPGVSSLGFAGWNLWYLGYPDRALARAGQGVALARELAHPFSLAQALSFEVLVYWFRRDSPPIIPRAGELIALSERHGFPLWLGIGKLMRGVARSRMGEHAAGFEEASEGATLVGGIGLQMGAPSTLGGGLAEAQATAGQPTEALGCIDLATAVGAMTGQSYFDAELHRAKAELLLAMNGGDETEAVGLLRRAVEIAREQGARSLELRASVSLARCLQAKGDATGARALLEPVYRGFSEGFETADLLGARAVLESLGDGR